VDRLLKLERKKFQLRPGPRTKPATLLKSQVAVRTFSEWDEKRAGFGEIDLVSHDGGGMLRETFSTVLTLPMLPQVGVKLNRSATGFRSGLFRLWKK